jgi:hypothetical protein
VSSLAKLVLSAAIASAIPMAHAQQAPSPCKVYFAMFQFDTKLGLLPIVAFTRDQSKWFEKRGHKKYPEFCLDGGKATYVMVTARWDEGTSKAVNRTHRAYTTGSTPAVVGTTAAGPDKPSQQVWGTQLSTFVTTWQEEEMEVVRVPHAIVFTFSTKDGKPLAEAEELKPQPICTNLRGLGGSAAKDAFDCTLECLRRLE